MNNTPIFFTRKWLTHQTEKVSLMKQLKWKVYVYSEQGNWERRRTKKFMGWPDVYADELVTESQANEMKLEIIMQRHMVK